ncbi:hypothetical protein K1719_015250 [Acacia pycnantha]|nr:hypothetical protein K1719_015250 [Acacia pycnantha]
MRKLCTLELLSSSKINSFRPMRKEELDLLIDSLKEATRDGDSVDLSAKVAALSANMSCRMVLGKKYMDDEFDEKGFKAVVKEGMYLSATPNMGDYIPFIAGLDLQGLNRRMKAVAKTFDDFFEKIIDEHVHHQSNNNKDKKTKDFVDVMLDFVGTEESEYRIERPNIKAIMADMLGGSMDTSTTSIEWTMSDLMKNPGVMKKVQKELEMVVGMERKVEESDLENLEYLNMDFELIPFGAGRRGCPGLQLGLTVISLVVAQLVHCFDWDIPRGMLPSDLDMTEEFGLTMPRANHLVAVPTKYRLQH